VPESSERDAWAAAGWVSTPGVDEEDLIPVPFRAPPPKKARRPRPLPPPRPLGADLADLERTDPAVAAAAARLRETTEEIARRWEARVAAARARAEEGTDRA
jgi:hypothetical protein